MPHTIDPHTKRFLQRLDHTSSTKKPVAVFDCDDTLIKGDIGESMFYFQLEHFLLRVAPAELWPDHPKIDELNNLYDGLHALPPDKAVRDRRFTTFAEMMLDWYFDQLAQSKTVKGCSDIVRLFTDFTPAEVRQIAEATLAQELRTAPANHQTGRHSLPRGIRFIRESIDLLDELRTRGFDVWVVSGSNQWSVEAVCVQIGVPSNRVIGIDLIEKDGVFTSSIKEPVPVLKGKIKALQKRIKDAPCIVVSDSTYDIPLFQYSTDLKVLIASERQRDFFLSGKVEHDESWLVIEPTTLSGLPDLP